MKKKEKFNKTSRICKWCGKEFIPRQRKSITCSKECRIAYNINLTREKKYKELLENGIEGIDYVIDLWSGNPTRRIYGKYFEKHYPNRTIDEYKAEFPNAPLNCQKDKEAMSKCTEAAIKYMRSEEGKKHFSEIFKGQNNPNSKSNTTYEERCSRSPFSKKFYEKRGLSEKERRDFCKKTTANTVSNTSLQYYLNKGYDLETAKKLHHNRQATNTIENYIKKYGTELGPIKWEERKRTWSAKIEEKYQRGEFSKAPKNPISFVISKGEIELIEKILSKLNLNPKDYFYYKNKNGQFSLYDITLNCHYFYDFCYKNKIIEFNGDFWHMNPNLFESTDINKITKRTAEEIWNKDEEKRKVAEDNGFDVLYIWESDFVDNPDECVEKCIEFLKED